MLDAFSYNREYDYIRLEGLYRATGRPAHEWDFYIVKELIDNALDADEVLWYSDSKLFPTISISMEYIPVPPPQSQQLIIRVKNRAQFPIKRIANIFATQWYTSDKSFFKGITRGALGNALKTLLGIPYALHNRVAEDWVPDLKPLSICSGAVEYLPRYIIDPVTRTIRFECQEKPCPLVTGTVISVGLDYFVQERPRIVAEIEILAQQYALCNPHAKFHWIVELQNQVREITHTAQADWAQKYRSLAPVQWYSLAGFKDLLGALQRRHMSTIGSSLLPVQTVCLNFPGFNDSSSMGQRGSLTIRSVMQDVGQNSFTPEDINSPFAKSLYAAIGKHSPAFQASQLGCIGQERIQSQLSKNLPVTGRIHYAFAANGEDPSTPFVIEVAVAYLHSKKRQVWTALNFSPTYNDPFLSRWFYPPQQPEEAVLGLRGLLDTYSIREEAHFLLFLHLICPNIEHNEFSKTEINHLPFKKVLTELIDKVLQELRQGQEEEGMRLEQTVFRALNIILGKLSKNERFIPEQLLETLRRQLSQDTTLIAWLERPEALNRLRAYIESYQGNNPEINTFIARRAEVLLALPSHPQHYFSIPIEQLSRDLLEKHAVSKILAVQPQELESVVIANNWLCRMDMALLQVPDVGILQEALLHCIGQNDLPVLVLHEGDEKGYALVEQVRVLLKQQQRDVRSIIDLQERRKQGEALQPAKVMPDELETWLLARFATLNIPIKYIPSTTKLIQDIRSYFDHLLREYVVEEMEQQFALTSLLHELDTTLSYTEMMRTGKVDTVIQQYLLSDMKTESYRSVLNGMVEKFFEYFISIHGSNVHQLEQNWFTRKQGE
jgi:hypothetical protein